MTKKATAPAAAGAPNPDTPEPFSETLARMKEPVPADLVRTREGYRDRQGNAHLVEFVDWQTVAEVLDRLAPTWCHAVRAIVQVGETVAVTAAITIHGVTREGVGTGTANNENGVKKAEHDALKRAALKFGIAAEVYRRESEIIEATGSGQAVEVDAGGFPRDPRAKSMADLITPKQLGMIRALAREAGVDVDEESRRVMRVGSEELSKRAASSYIDHLKELARNQPPQTPKE
jgi:hypothetical protein